jgi:hypothetical protein
MKPSETPKKPSPAPEAAAWVRRLTGAWAAAAVLLVFWAVMAASLRDKSLTYDEVAHAASGYSYWRYGDYRLQPENGQLPQRVAGLPLLMSLASMPTPDPSAWQNAEQWQLGVQWFYRSGNDAAALAAWGRALCGLFAVALGALVWAWSRRMFGPVGAMLSLVLYVLNPTVLANGSLMTSDMAAALFFAAATGAMASLVERLTPGRLLLSAAAVAALFLTKASAVLTVPLAALLIGARIADPRPLRVELPGWSRELARRSLKTLALLAAVGVHAVLVVATIWAAYGFRYSAFSGYGGHEGRFRLPWEYLLGKTDPVHALDKVDLDAKQQSQAAAILEAAGALEPKWSNWSISALKTIRAEVLTQDQARKLDAAISVPSTVLWVRAVEWARDRRLLPESWIYGFTDVYRRSQVRAAFLNGDFRMQGWPGFFPYTFLVKTPLSVFGIALLALGAVRWRRLGWGRVQPVLPLMMLVVIYGVAAVTSHLNIGHRHLLPLYAPLFILCGAAGRWFEACLPKGPGDEPVLDLLRRGLGLVGMAVVGSLATETLIAFPNYLAYFNGIVSPRNAYRHLVDSSLDWGQDLPAVRAYLDAHGPSGAPYFLSYFGTSSPAYYGIGARLLYSVAGVDNKPDWRNYIIPSDQAAAEIPGLAAKWPEHDVLGTQEVGGVVIAPLLRKPEYLALGPGTYLISASMLEPVNFSLSGPFGPWNPRYEAAYQELDAEVRPLLSTDLAVRGAALQARSANQWADILERFEEFRFARLTAYLRKREPDEELDFSVLVYRLGEADLAKALGGPAPESGPDLGKRELDLLPDPHPGS